MKCITYGWVVLFLIILSVVVSILGVSNPGLAAGIYLIGFLGVHAYWLFGFVDECKEGYYGNLQKKLPKVSATV